MNSTSDNLEGENIRTRYGLTEKQWVRFQLVEDKQQILHETLQTQKFRQSTLERGLKCRTDDDFVRHVTESAEQAENNFRRRRQRGWRVWSRKFETFSVNARGFMDDLNPVLDIVKGVGSPYTGLAIGTVSILFGIVASKKATDDQMSSAITRVKDRLPGFQVYQRIYTLDTELGVGLQKDILLAYTAFIDLVVEATNYYLKPGYRRWLNAVFLPNKFQELGVQVDDSIQSVRRRCEELLSLKVDQIKEQNMNLQGKVQILNDVIKELRVAQSNNNLSKLRHQLQLDHWSPGVHLQSFKEHKMSFYREREQEDYIVFTQMSGKFLREWKHGKDFRQWAAERRSSIMILVGENNSNIDEGKRHCWASPLVWNIFEELQERQDVTAFDFCSVQNPEGVSDITIRILYQLLSAKKEALETDNTLAALQAKIKAYNSCSDEDSKLSALRALAQPIFKLFNQEETVYVLLDRMNMCEGIYQKELLNLFADIISLSACTIKFLAVANRGPFWSIDDTDLSGVKRRFKDVIKVSIRQGLSHEGF